MLFEKVGGLRAVLTDEVCGGVSEAACSRQTNSFVFTRGMTKVQALDADHNCLVGV